MVRRVDGGGVVLTPHRKRTSKVTHWFKEDGKSLCGLRLGLEKDWPLSYDTYRCRTCEAIKLTWEMNVSTLVDMERASGRVTPE